MHVQGDININMAKLIRKEKNIANVHSIREEANFIPTFSLIKRPATIFWIAKTWQFLTFIFMVEVVVISDFFSWIYVPFSKENDLWYRREFVIFLFCNHSLWGKKFKEWKARNFQQKFEDTEEFVASTADGME